MSKTGVFLHVLAICGVAGLASGQQISLEGRRKGGAFKLEVQQSGRRLLAVFCSRGTSSAGC